MFALPILGCDAIKPHFTSEKCNFPPRAPRKKVLLREHLSRTYRARVGVPQAPDSARDIFFK
jgi:hypothetical protein